MRSTWEVSEAIRSVTGWTATMAAAICLAVWLGLWIGGGHFPPLITPIVLLGGTALVFFFPPFCLIWAVTWLAWYLPLRFESPWMRAGAVFVLLMWFGIALGVGRAGWLF
jgi:hypothetical protein